MLGNKELKIYIIHLNTKGVISFPIFRLNLKVFSHLVDGRNKSATGKI